MYNNRENLSKIRDSKGIIGVGEISKLKIVKKEEWRTFSALHSQLYTKKFSASRFTTTSYSGSNP